MKLFLLNSRLRYESVDIWITENGARMKELWFFKLRSSYIHIYIHSHIYSYKLTHPLRSSPSQQNRDTSAWTHGLIHSPADTSPSFTSCLSRASPIPWKNDREFQIVVAAALTIFGEIGGYRRVAHDVALHWRSCGELRWWFLSDLEADSSLLQPPSSSSTCNFRSIGPIDV